MHTHSFSHDTPSESGWLRAHRNTVTVPTSLREPAGPAGADRPTASILSLGPLSVVEKNMKRMFQCLYRNLLKLLNPDTNQPSLSSGGHKMCVTQLSFSWALWSALEAIREPVFQPGTCFGNVFEGCSLKDSRDDRGVPPAFLHTPPTSCTEWSCPLNSVALMLLEGKTEEPCASQVQQCLMLPPGSLGPFLRRWLFFFAHLK